MKSTSKDSNKKILKKLPYTINVMKEKVKKPIIEEIKHELDEMEGILKKSGDEFKNYYKAKKKNFAELIKNYAHEFEASGEEKIHELKESTGELLDLLESDYDLSYTDYENESHKISKAIDKFEGQAKIFVSKISEKSKSTRVEIEEDLHKNLEKFRGELDIQKAHWKGTKERALAEFEDWKKSRLSDIEKLKKELEQKKMETEEKIGEFSEELIESFDHLKKAFKKLW
jgi:hypothetical protein